MSLVPESNNYSAKSFIIIYIITLTSLYFSVIGAIVQWYECSDVLWIWPFLSLTAAVIISCCGYIVRYAKYSTRIAYYYELELYHALYNTAQCSAVWYSTVQYNAMQQNATQHKIIMKWRTEVVYKSSDYWAHSHIILKEKMLTFFLFY